MKWRAVGVGLVAAIALPIYLDRQLLQEVFVLAIIGLGIGLVTVKWREWGVLAGFIVFAVLFLPIKYSQQLHHIGPSNINPTPVLVAKELIPKGTPGSLVLSQSMYAPTTLPRKEVEDGAISDPQWLSGRAAALDIFPGQQLTATDFAPRLASLTR